MGNSTDDVGTPYGFYGDEEYTPMTDPGYCSKPFDPELFAAGYRHFAASQKAPDEPGDFPEDAFDYFDMESEPGDGMPEELDDWSYLTRDPKE